MTSSEPTVESPAAPVSSRRRTALIVVAIVAGFVLLLGVAAAWRLAGVESVAQVGERAAIPGGTVRVDDIEHVEPADLGAPLPDGSHAVQISLTVAADDEAPTIVSADDFAVEGTGILAPIVASRAEPRDATVPQGRSVPMVLVFAVPDASSQLILAGPGGALMTAEHDDHPGSESE